MGQIYYPRQIRASNINGRHPGMFTRTEPHQGTLLAVGSLLPLTRSGTCGGINDTNDHSSALTEQPTATGR
jgi:hypothetical protein